MYDYVHLSPKKQFRHSLGEAASVYEKKILSGDYDKEKMSGVINDLCNSKTEEVRDVGSTLKMLLNLQDTEKDTEKDKVPMYTIDQVNDIIECTCRDLMGSVFFSLSRRYDDPDIEAKGEVHIVYNDNNITFTATTILDGMRFVNTGNVKIINKDIKECKEFRVTIVHNNDNNYVDRIDHITN
jgi:hypothetical protein